MLAGSTLCAVQQRESHYPEFGMKCVWTRYRRRANVDRELLTSWNGQKIWKTCFVSWESVEETRARQRDDVAASDWKKTEFLISHFQCPLIPPTRPNLSPSFSLPVPPDSRQPVTVFPSFFGVP